MSADQGGNAACTGRPPAVALKHCRLGPLLILKGFARRLRSGSKGEHAPRFNLLADSFNTLPTVREDDVALKGSPPALQPTVKRCIIGSVLIIWIVTAYWSVKVDQPDRDSA